MVLVLLSSHYKEKSPIPDDFFWTTQEKSKCKIIFGRQMVCGQLTRRRSFIYLFHVLFGTSICTAKYLDKGAYRGFHYSLIPLLKSVT
jgi:hypothetical protein